MRPLIQLDSGVHKDDNKIMPSPALDQPETLYTYADYLTWDDGNRYELIDGRAYMMAGPSGIHQRLSMAIGSLIWNCLRGTGCEALAAPLDVNLAAEQGLESRDIVQPDLIVTCFPDKIGKRGFEGVPELVIEIESTSTAKYDLNEKFQKYMESGVREYWFVKPGDRAILVFLFADKKQESMMAYHWPDEVTSTVHPGVKISIKDIFER